MLRIDNRIHMDRLLRVEYITCARCLRIYRELIDVTRAKLILAVVADRQDTYNAVKIEFRNDFEKRFDFPMHEKWIFFCICMVWGLTLLLKYPQVFRFLIECDLKWTFHENFRAYAHYCVASPRVA